MNERIKELAEQALRQSMTHDGVYRPEGNDNSVSKVFADKFAELIVTECLCIVESNNPRPPGTTKMYSLDQDEYFDTGWQVAVETKSRQIKKYFGVE